MMDGETRHGAARMRDYFQSLQVVRAVACLGVVFAHLLMLESIFQLKYLPSEPFIIVGAGGVDAFFMLSGFIIGTTTRADLGRPGRLPVYLFRRFWRIFPVFWIALGIGAAAHVAFRPGSLFGPGWVENLIGAFVLLPGSPGLLAVPAAWTLPSEVAFYLVFATLFLLPRRAAGPVLAAWALAALGLAATGHNPANRFAGVWVSPYVLEFVAGCFIAWWPVRFAGPRAAAVGLAGVAWLAVALGLKIAFDPNWMPHQAGQRVLVFGPGFALLVLALTGWERAGGRVGLRWLQRVGDASYSIFLLHSPCLFAAFWGAFHLKWGHGKSSHYAWIAMMFAAGVLPGLLFYRYVERPLIGLWKRKPKAAVPQATPAPVRVAA